MKNRFFTSPFLFFLPFFFFGMEGSLLSVEYFRAGVFGVEDMCMYGLRYCRGLKKNILVKRSWQKHNEYKRNGRGSDYVRVWLHPIGDAT